MVSKRVNVQLSISSCLNLLASQMDRGDKVSFSKAYFLNGCPKLSRQLARYYLAIALFQSPLAERSVTVSVSLRSPAVKLVASRRQVTRSATMDLRISRTAWLLNADHLCPFALWTTFSSSPLEPSP